MTFDCKIAFMLKKVLAVCFLAVVSIAQAWDGHAHKVVAQIAWKTMKPATRKWVTTLLSQNHPDGAQSKYIDIMSAATMADDYKHRPSGSSLPVNHKWDNWHFDDNEISDSNQLLASWPQDVPNDTVLFGIQETVQALKHKSSSTSSMGDPWNLAMLLHFVGDIHQPLHCADDHDKGGNNFKVKYSSSINNLHSLWDDVLTETYNLRHYATDTDLQNAAAKLMHMYPKTSFQGKFSMQYQPSIWAEESYEQAVKVGYGGAAKNGRQTPAYLNAWKAVGLQRIALAGYRLAKLLDGLAAGH